MGRLVRTKARFNHVRNRRGRRSRRSEAGVWRRRLSRRMMAH